MTAVIRRNTWAVAGSLLAVAVLASAVTGTAAAATSGSGLYITGAGFGHGVGMSQYGAAGYAEHGFNYREILERYYSQTTIGAVNPNRVVTVLLKPGGSPSFSGATRISGSPVKLKPTTQYSVRAVGQQLELVTGTQTVGVFSAPLKVTGAKPMTLVGAGTYRGAFLFRPTGSGGVQTVNALGLDEYVRGVVGAEMPTAWPAQALEAQAVAARTYAITAGAIQADFDVYDDTRSQMYEGIKAETPATDSAVAATSGQVVDYDGTPAVTYFFASSGGQTESVQNVFSGVTPESWLVSRPDPYDDSFNNPYYRWKLDLALSAADRKLGKLVEGSLDGIRVLSRGVSPRIVQARIVGSQGSAIVSGELLEKDLGTPSTWMSLTTISAAGTQTTSISASAPPSSKGTKTTKTTATVTPTTSPSTTATTPTNSTTTTTIPGTVTTVTATTPTTTPPPASGGQSPTGSGDVASAARALATRASATREDPASAEAERVRHFYSVHGTIFPATAGARIFVQRRRGLGWDSVASGREEASGAYSVPVPEPGLYRILYGTVIGPQITVR
jgi:stage II sporulation protein D